MREAQNNIKNRFEREGYEKIQMIMKDKVN